VIPYDVKNGAGKSIFFRTLRPEIPVVFLGSTVRAVPEKNGEIKWLLAQFLDDPLEGADAPCVPNDGKRKFVLFFAMLQHRSVCREVPEQGRQRRITFFLHHDGVYLEGENQSAYNDGSGPEHDRDDPMPARFMFFHLFPSFFELFLNFLKSYES
jgi:hypothetical protein